MIVVGVVLVLLFVALGAVVHGVDLLSWRRTGAPTWYVPKSIHDLRLELARARQLVREAKERDIAQRAAERAASRARRDLARFGRALDGRKTGVFPKVR